METTIPLFPCKSLDDTLEFYKALGFVITHEQRTPYLYGAVRQGGLELHFSRLSMYGAKNAFGTCLVFVPDVSLHHHSFSDALRTKYGKIPTFGFPRITRLRKGQTRFKLFDPSGNLIIYINQDEPETDYGLSDENLALDNAVFLRDTYANDQAAAKVLDKARTQSNAATPIAHARVLAARAELAVAMGEAELAKALKIELKQIPLSDEERKLYKEELEAPDEIARWIGTGDL